MSRINSLVEYLPLLFCTCVLMGCASAQSLTPGTGSSISVNNKTYEEVWDTSVKVVSQNLTIVDTNKSSGVIRASSGIGLLSWGEVVAVFVKPATQPGEAHTLEVVSQTVSKGQVSGTGWELVIISSLRESFPNSVSSRVQRFSWRVHTRDGNDLNDVFLVDLQGDSLRIIHRGRHISAHVSSIAQIVQARPSRFWKGAGIGTLSGMLIGGIVGYASNPTGGGHGYGRIYDTLLGTLVGGVPGFLIGGIIGAAAGGDKVYVLSDLSLEKKRALLESILHAE